MYSSTLSWIWEENRLRKSRWRSGCREPWCRLCIVMRFSDSGIWSLSSTSSFKKSRRIEKEGLRKWRLRATNYLASKRKKEFRVMISPSEKKKMQARAKKRTLRNRDREIKIIARWETLVSIITLRTLLNKSHLPRSWIKETKRKERNKIVRRKKKIAFWRIFMIKTEKNMVLYPFYYFVNKLKTFLFNLFFF